MRYCWIVLGLILLVCGCKREADHGTLLRLGKVTKISGTMYKPLGSSGWDIYKVETTNEAVISSITKELENLPVAEEKTDNIPHIRRWS